MASTVIIRNKLLHCFDCIFERLLLTLTVDRQHAETRLPVNMLKNGFLSHVFLFVFGIFFFPVSYSSTTQKRLQIVCSCTDSGISLVEVNVAFPLCQFTQKDESSGKVVCCSIMVSEWMPYFMCVEKYQSLPNQGVKHSIPLSLFGPWFSAFLLWPVWSVVFLFSFCLVCQGHNVTSSSILCGSVRTVGFSYNSAWLRHWVGVYRQT